MGMFGFLLEIPFVYMAALGLLSVFFIFYYSRREKINFTCELFKYFKGIVLLILLSFGVFSTTLFLKYMSFLKIDILQPDLLAVAAFVGISIILMFEYSLKSFEQISKKLSRIPYIFKQFVLISAVFCVFYVVTSEIDIRKIVYASLVPSIIYHLLYVRVHVQIVKFFRYISQKYDKITKVKK